MSVLPGRAISVFGANRRAPFRCLLPVACARVALIAASGVSVSGVAQGQDFVATPDVAVAPPPPPAAPPPSVAPAAAAAPAAPAAAAVSPNPAPPPARTVSSPGQALVHVAVNRRDAWLEMRNYVDGGEFIRTCRTPCDAVLQVEGHEARVAAPGMTTSNIFRIAAGSGTAGVRVDGGSASARHIGIITLAVGIPVALAGMAFFAQGRLSDKAGLEAAGIAGLASGGLSIAISLPLLLMGATRVKDANGSLIAASEPTSRL